MIPSLLRGGFRDLIGKHPERLAGRISLHLSAFQSKGLRPKIAERTGDIAVMHSMVANGFGYGITNMRPLNTMSPDGKPLVFIPLNDDIRPLTMGVAIPNAEHRTRTMQAFIDHCRNFVLEQGVLGIEQNQIGH